MRNMLCACLLAIAAGSAAFATITSFGVSGSSLDTIIVGGAGSTPTAGCGQVDLGFNGFSTSGIATTAETAFQTTGPSSGGGTSIADINGIFSGSNWGTNAGSVIGHVLDVAQVIGAPDGDSPDAPFVTWGITGLSLGATPSFSGPGTDPADVVSVQSVFCLGTLTCATTDSNYGYLAIEFDGNAGTVSQTVCTPGAGGCTTSSGSSSITFGTYYTEIAFDTVFLVHSDSTNFISLVDFTDTFSQQAETPEPATFLLISTALIGLAALRFARRGRVS